MLFPYDDPERLHQINESVKDKPYVEQINFEDSVLGKMSSELQKLRQEFDQYQAEQKAKDIADEERQRTERKRNSIISRVFGSFRVFSGLVIYYWPDITAWLHSIFQ